MNALKDLATIIEIKTLSNDLQRSTTLLNDIDAFIDFLAESLHGCKDALVTNTEVEVYQQKMHTLHYENMWKLQELVELVEL